MGFSGYGEETNAKRKTGSLKPGRVLRIERGVNCGSRTRRTVLIVVTNLENQEVDWIMGDRGFSASEAPLEIEIGM